MAMTSFWACQWPGLRPVYDATAAASSSASGRRAQSSVRGAFQLNLGESVRFTVNAGSASTLGHNLNVGGIRCGFLGRKENLRRGVMRLSADGLGYTASPALKVEPAKRVNSRRRFALSSTLIVAEGDEDNDNEEKAKMEVKIDLQLPRRRLLVEFTCDVCQTRTQRLVNPEAYKRGTVYVQCGGCEAYHKLVDNLGLVEEYDFRNEADANST